MMTHPRLLDRGILVAIEGIDGAGKTTQTHLLISDLLEKGYSAVPFKEPTDGRWGKKIKDLVANGRSITPKEECELFVRDRMDDVRYNIRPALEKRMIVVMDRYYYSNMAYQGALDLDMDEIREINEEFAPIPDLMVILDIPPNVGISRIMDKRNDHPNHFEGFEYLEKVREQFDRMRSYANVQKVDGSSTIEVVSEKINNMMDSIIQAVAEGNEEELAETDRGFTEAETR